MQLRHREIVGSDLSTGMSIQELCMDAVQLIQMYYVEARLFVLGDGCPAKLQHQLHSV